MAIQSEARNELLTAINEMLRGQVEPQTENLCLAMRDYLQAEISEECKGQSEASATLMTLHQNWRRRLTLTIGADKVLAARAEQAEAVALTNAIRDGRKVGEK